MEEQLQDMPDFGTLFCGSSNDYGSFCTPPSCATATYKQRRGTLAGMAGPATLVVTRRGAMQDGLDPSLTNIRLPP